MWSATLPAGAGVAGLSALSAAYALVRIRRRDSERRLGVRFTFPTPTRANLVLTFDAEGVTGPFAARVSVVDGDLSLTRDSVDGQPDGEDRSELIAPMSPFPIGGESAHRVQGMIGIEAPAAPNGRIGIEIFDRGGRMIFSEIHAL